MSKYFIAQALARAFLLLGIVYRYYKVGEINLFSDYDFFSYSLIMIGLFLKIAVVPNPYWFIDSIRGLKFFEGFYIIIMSKIIPIYLYITLSSGVFSKMLLFVGVSSIAVGRILALNQTKTRKIIALSSIAHLG